MKQFSLLTIKSVEQDKEKKKKKKYLSGGWRKDQVILRRYQQRNIDGLAHLYRSIDTNDGS